MCSVAVRNRVGVCSVSTFTLFILYSDRKVNKVFCVRLDSLDVQIYLQLSMFQNIV